MQRAIENIGAGVVADGDTHRIVVSLGSDPNTQAGNAAASAFKFSALAATWTYVNINGAAAISNFFNGVGAVNINNTGLIMLDSGSNVLGGCTASELSVITAQASKLNSFLGAGGPYQETFSNIGTIPVLGVGVGANAARDIIIGASAGTITAPVSTPVPEPASLVALGAGLLGFGLVRRRNA